MDNQTPNGPYSAGPVQAPQQPVYVASQNNKPNSRGKTVFTILLFVLLIGGLGYLGYTYKSTNDKLRQQSQKLSDAYVTIEEFQAIIDKQEAVDTFVAEQNDEILSRQLCGGTPVGMFDVHLNDQFAVFRYLCSKLKSGAPIRIASLKKLSNGSYEFTYGSSDAQPNTLPSYIYDSEPDFFAVYDATKF